MYIRLLIMGVLHCCGAKLVGGYLKSFLKLTCSTYLAYLLDKMFVVHVYEELFSGKSMVNELIEPTLAAVIDM